METKLGSKIGMVTGRFMAGPSLLDSCSNRLQHANIESFHIIDTSVGALVPQCSLHGALASECFCLCFGSRLARLGG